MEALGTFLQDAASLMEKVAPHSPAPMQVSPFLLPVHRTVSLGVPIAPHRSPSRSPQVSSMTSLAELRRELGALTAPNVSTAGLGAFRALSRIACGHPEGGGLRVPSLNWYEDNDVKAFLDRNSSERRAAAPGSASSERAGGGRLGFCWAWLGGVGGRVAVVRTCLCPPPGPFCRELLRSLESSPVSQIFWRGIKPLFTGKILYTPPGPGPDSIMAEVSGGPAAGLGGVIPIPASPPGCCR